MVLELTNSPLPRKGSDYVPFQFAETKQLNTWIDLGRLLTLHSIIDIQRSGSP